MKKVLFRCIYIYIYVHVHVPYTKNANLTDAETDAHIVRIDIRCVIHNVGFSLF